MKLQWERERVTTMETAQPIYSLFFLYYFIFLHFIQYKELVSAKSSRLCVVTLRPREDLNRSVFFLTFHLLLFLSLCSKFCFVFFLWSFSASTMASRTKWVLYSFVVFFVTYIHNQTPELVIELDLRFYLPFSLSECNVFVGYSVADFSKQLLLCFFLLILFFWSAFVAFYISFFYLIFFILHCFLNNSQIFTSH